MSDDKIKIRELVENDKVFRLFMEESIQPIWWFEIDEPYSIDLPEDDQVEFLFNRAYIKIVNKAYAEVAGIERRENLYGLYPRQMQLPSLQLNTAAKA